METVRCCCSISTHTNYHAYLYAHYRKYTDSGGNFHTHDTPDCPHMGAIYTMLEPRVDRLALAVSLHPRYITPVPKLLRRVSFGSCRASYLSCSVVGVPYPFLHAIPFT